MLSSSSCPRRQTQSPIPTPSGGLALVHPHSTAYHPHGNRGCLLPSSPQQQVCKNQRPPAADWPWVSTGSSTSLSNLQARARSRRVLSASAADQTTEAENMAALPLATAEVCDANSESITNGELRALQPIFRIYGRRQTFAGPVVTLKIFEDNVLLREFLEEKGHGRVLVVDGGGSMRCAVLGGNLAQLAQNNGWAGIVVNGCIRDVDEINGCDVGVRALNSHPMKSNKKGVGEKHVPVTIAGTRICDGEWLYADTDAILLSRSELTV